MLTICKEGTVVNDRQKSKTTILIFKNNIFVFTMSCVNETISSIKKKRSIPEHAMPKSMDTF